MHYMVFNTNKGGRYVCKFIFEWFGSDLVLSQSEKDSITTSIDTIKRRLGYYFSDVTEKNERYPRYQSFKCLEVLHYCMYTYPAC